MGMPERTIVATTHGRYLIRAPRPGLPMLVGFHGYAESAETDLARLQSIEGSDRWIVVAVQGLHRFYRGRSSDVVAGWMTTQNRELAIEDNKIYTSKVIEAVSQEWTPASGLVLSGFSQGVAMAFRAATNCNRSVSGVISLAGDVPPELDARALSRIPAVLIGRGTRDEWYTERKAEADERRLREAGVDVQMVVFDGAHEWTPEFAKAAGRCLELWRM